jgi:hypothetical protein
MQVTDIPSWGLGTRLLTLLCKKLVLWNPKKWKPDTIWQNLANDDEDDGGGGGIITEDGTLLKVHSEDGHTMDPVLVWVLGATRDCYPLLHRPSQKHVVLTIHINCTKTVCDAECSSDRSWHLGKTFSQNEYNSAAFSKAMNKKHKRTKNETDWGSDCTVPAVNIIQDQQQITGKI